MGDGTVRSSKSDLHEHLHKLHFNMENGDVPCPIGGDNFVCVCKTTFNCRQSFILHTGRCATNLEVVRLGTRSATNLEVERLGTIRSATNLEVERLGTITSAKNLEVASPEEFGPNGKFQKEVENLVKENPDPVLKSYLSTIRTTQSTLDAEKRDVTETETSKSPTPSKTNPPKVQQKKKKCKKETKIGKTHEDETIALGTEMSETEAEMCEKLPSVDQMIDNNQTNFKKRKLHCESGIASVALV